MSQSFAISESNNVMVAKFQPNCPKIDARNYEEIQKEIIDILKSKEVDEFVFDLNEITYVSSAGLRMFSAINKVAVENCIDYKLINLVSDVYRMFELTGYTGAFRIEEKIII